MDAWLGAFESALKARDIAAAAGLFATESYWRDLVAFTWNLKTVEGRDGVTDLLNATLDTPTPSGSRPRNRPTRPTAWSRPGSVSRPRPGGAAGCCG